ncbi:MAG: serine hydrolase domain-containing protein [Pseudomonadota bacterium]
MNNLALTFCGILTSAFLLCGNASGAAEPFASTLLRELRDTSGVPGMAAAVFKDGKLAWHGEAGFANMEQRKPVTKLTGFRLASVSKFITTAMLAQAVEQGRFDLNRPVASYLPAYAGHEPISALQLATHTSGMPHYDLLRDFDLADDTRQYRNATQAIHIFKDRALASKPGTRYLYSSFGFNLLSATMEQALQRDFPSMLGDFTARAGVVSLQAERPHGSDEQLADLYDAGNKRLARGNISNIWAGGGLVSNASDLAQIGARLLDPAFLSSATLQRFTTPAVFDNGEPIVVGRFTMGIGWRLGVDHRGRAFFHHSGSIRGGRSHISVYPKERLVVALLVNTDWVSAMDVTSSVLLDMVGEAAPAAPCKSESYRYQGRYGQAEIEGTLESVVQPGHCRLVLGADNALGKWLANNGKRRSFTLHDKILVAPVGLFSVTRDGAKLLLRLPGGTLELQLRESVMARR